MTTEHRIKIIRAKEAYKIFGICRASFYKRIAEGIIPPQINLGGRAVGFLESELQAVLKAFIAGKDQTEVKEIVKELVIQRQQLI